MAGGVSLHLRKLGLREFLEIRLFFSMETGDIALVAGPLRPEAKQDSVEGHYFLSVWSFFYARASRLSPTLGLVVGGIGGCVGWGAPSP